MTRPLARLPTFGDLPDWQAIDLLFRKHGLDVPPARLRDELVCTLGWAKFGQSVSDNADEIRATRNSRQTYGGTHYEIEASLDEQPKGCT